MNVSSGVRPSVGHRYRVTDRRNRIFEGVVRSVEGDIVDLDVTASKSEFIRTIDEMPGDLVTVDASHCVFERLG